MKWNNKILFSVLIGLAAVYAGKTYLRQNNTDTALSVNHFAVDTLAISKIEIHKPRVDQRILFSKNAEQWEVSNGTKQSEINRTAFSNLLNELQKLKVERLVSKSKEKWKDYELTDSLATKVLIGNSKTKKNKTIFIGKTNYNPPTNQYGQYRMSGTTYVRMAGDPKVYAVASMLSNTFNRDFSAWRNSQFLKFDTKSVTSLLFDYSEKQKFALRKKDSVWHLDQNTIDKDKVSSFLSKIAYQNSTKFADAFQPNQAVFASVTIQTKDQELAKINAYQFDSNRYYLHSSQRPNVYFESDSVGLYKQIFVGKNKFEKD